MRHARRNAGRWAAGAMEVRSVLLLLLALAALLSGGFGVYMLTGSEAGSPSLKRSDPNGLIYDFGGVLKDQLEYTQRFLASLRHHYQIEGVVVSVPSLQGAADANELALQIMNEWAIGKGYDGRGLLLLLVNDVKQVKLEVSYALEDVFTDRFTGYAEDLQLKPYFRQGNIGIGLLAVMEEVDRRAQIKRAGNYTPEKIAQLDSDFASGGAGAGRALNDYANSVSNASSSPTGDNSAGTTSIYTDSGLLALGEQEDGRFPAGRTPEEAWRNMIAATREKALKTGDEYAKRDLADWEGRPYSILSNAGFAVISFGNKKGWENTPLLFARTSHGWQQDMVNQRHYVRHGDAPRWFVERGDHPYMDLVEDLPTGFTCDIPWEENDIYRVENDRQIVRRILDLEKRFKNNPDDFDAAIELGRLSIMTARRPWFFLEPLSRAKALRPDSPLPYKYLAAGQVRSTYQYKTGIREGEEFVKRDPSSVFGRSLLGYLYSQTHDYESAISHLTTALQLDPSNCFARTKLTYARGLLLAASRGQDRDGTEQGTLEEYQKARKACPAGHRRIKWLEHWLRTRGLL